MITTTIKGRHCEIFHNECGNDLMIDFFPQEIRVIQNGKAELLKQEKETGIEVRELAEDFVKTNFHLASIIEP